MLKDDFVVETLDDHVARVCLDLGLDPDRIAGWRNLPDPPPRGDRPTPKPLWDDSA